MTSLPWIKIGTVGKPHGIRGSFFISGRSEPIAAELEYILIGPTPDHATKHEIASRNKSKPVIGCKSIASIEAVQPIAGQSIWIHREQLSVDYAKEYLWLDLIGKDVVDKADRLVGKIARVENFGAADIVIIHKDKQELPLPLVSYYFDMSFDARSPLRLVVDESTFVESWQPCSK
ncbi:MAG: ribosome maturation factor RimM [Oligoflexales bacterium]